MPYGPIPPGQVDLTLPDSPGNTVSANEATGNDNNDGFASPVQTLDRLSEVLRSYNWGNNPFVTINIDNPTGGTINATGLVNMGFVNFNIASAFTGSIDIENFDSATVVISSISLNGGALQIRNCANLSTIGTTISNFTGTSPIVASNNCQLSLGNIALSSVNSPSVVELRNNDYEIVLISTTSAVTVSQGLVRVLEGYTNLDYNIAASVTAFTGKSLQVDESASNCSIRLLGDPLATNESVASTYPASVAIGGTHVRGSFPSDAAAGLAGLVAGEIFQSDGLGAAPFDVAGSMFTKQ